MCNGRIIIFLYFLIFTSGASFAQTAADSVAFNAHVWKTTILAKGVVWKQAHFTDLFNSEQEINLIEINLRNTKSRLNLAAESQRLRKTSDMAKEYDALAAINGGFFDMKKGGAVDFIQVDGKIVNHTQAPSTRANALLLVSRKSLKITLADDSSYERARYPHVLLSGPLLLQDGKEHTLLKNAFNDNRHPRTAMGITKDNRLLLLVVDGRNRQAHGMNLHELTDVLFWLGAKDAMNLDGGGSSSLYIRGMSTTGIVNHPSDNKLFDHAGERPVANIIYIK